MKDRILKQTLLVIGLMLGVSGFALEPITLTVGDGTANRGDTAEVPVTLAVGDPAPSTLVLFLAYDAAKLAPNTSFYQFILQDLNGPVLDEHGNTIVTTSAVHPEAAVDAAEKLIETQVHPEGVLAIAVTGLNATTLGNGPLIKVAFRVLLTAQENEYLPVNGLGAGDTPVQLAHGPAISSAAGIMAEAIPVSFTDGRVHVGCTPAETPANVSATQGQSDAVVITWSAVADPHAEYRVYRGNDPNVSNALPLGEGWASATSFQDVTAQAPATVVPGGCFRSAQYEYVQYYYWVKSRNSLGCESAFSTPPVQGYRGSGKAAAQSAAVPPQTAGNVLLLGMLILVFFGVSARYVNRS